ncbi:hypothetical protein EYF80_055071 [Liparis tanakae]|uniref:Uncharacterized protein n=1 Tax=Liparis tanakae TaxID=230148 RepID=A0A4Z2F1W9_9TELE|nr:hypothetical protein EYF80_055071 [Liparis tanakae]
MFRKKANMFFSRKKLNTNRKMRISVMERMVSTRRFRLWSVTVVFLVRTWYMYLMGRHNKSREEEKHGSLRDRPNMFVV